MKALKLDFCQRPTAFLGMCKMYECIANTGNSGRNISKGVLFSACYGFIQVSVSRLSFSTIDMFKLKITMCGLLYRRKIGIVVPFTFE